MLALIMKKNILIASIFLCCSFCLTTTLSFGGERGLTPNGIKNHTERTSADGVFNIPQSGIPLITNIFGPSHQVCAGINIHFVTGHEKDLDMIAAAGFKFIRMDFGWQSIEREKGTYNWATYDELTANLEKRGLRAIYILDYSNSLYEEPSDAKNPITGKVQKSSASPQHPESIAAFARWAAAASGHFKGSNIIWEIWNEPNITFWKPKPDIAQYTALAMATCKAIKAVAPNATIIGPASSGLPWPFLESFLASGVLEYLDAVSIHPYRNYSKSPETADADYQKLRLLIDRYAPAGKKDMSIISSEWGYSTATKGVSLEKQAAYIVRMQLTNLLSGIPISIWYDWKNDGENSAENEHNFGTVSSDLKPKPAYTAIKTMNMELNGFTFTRRIDLKNEHDYVLLFRNDKGKYKISAWTMDPAHSVTIENNIPKVTKATAIDGNGNVLKLNTEQGKLVIDLNALPQYINLRHGIRIN